MIPLYVDRQEPANNQAGVEPNSPISIYFNKSMNPDLLQIEVLETAHGKIYKPLEAGSNMVDYGKIELKSQYELKNTYYFLHLIYIFITL